MACIKQALSFAEYFKEMSLEECEEFYRKFPSLFELIEEIKNKLPYYDKGHSGNSMNMSWMSYRCYKEKPELVGDQGYHDNRSDVPAWHWEPKDVRPEEGEYWSSRGVGYDLSGFVKTKAAGERILAMVHEVLGTDKCETYLDYRPSEPTWIQFQSSEFDLEKLDKLSREADRVITKEILKQCLHGKSN